MNHLENGRTEGSVFTDDWPNVRVVLVMLKYGKANEVNAVNACMHVGYELKTVIMYYSLVEPLCVPVPCRAVYLIIYSALWEIFNHFHSSVNENS